MSLKHDLSAYHLQILQDEAQINRLKRIKNSVVAYNTQECVYLAHTCVRAYRGHGGEHLHTLDLYQQWQQYIR